MTPLSALWLPIVLSAVLVFVASSIIHMFLGWHAGDYPSLPDEARFADAVRPLAINIFLQRVFSGAAGFGPALGAEVFPAQTGQGQAGDL